MKKRMGTVLLAVLLLTGLSFTGVAEDAAGKLEVYRVVSRDAETGEELVFHLGPWNETDESEIMRIARQYLDYNAKEAGYNPDDTCQVSVETDSAVRNSIIHTPIRVLEKESRILEETIQELREQVQTLEQEKAVLQFENGNLKRAMQESD